MMKSGQKEENTKKSNNFFHENEVSFEIKEKENTNFYNASKSKI